MRRWIATGQGRPALGPSRLLWAFVAVLVFGCMPNAWAADIQRVFVRPGEPVVVASSSKTITLDASAPATVKLTTDAGDGKPATLWVLTFQSAAEDSGEVAIGYKEGDESRSVIVQVSATPQPDASTLAEAGTILGQMLVIAIVLESAFAVIFNWRVFLEFFDGRGVRTVVMFVGGLIVATIFHQDFVGSLFDAYLGTGSNGEHTTLGTQLLTAMVLAGGSASVNQLLVALNLRQAKTAESVAEKVPPDKAWVAIKVSGLTDDDVVEVVDVGGEAAAADAEHLFGVMPAAGVKERLAKYFWRDRYRVPMNRGFVVDPAKEYAFVIRRTRKTGAATVTDNFDVTGRRMTYQPKAGAQPAPADPGAGAGQGANPVAASELTPPPRRYSFAKGALVDFRVTLPPPDGPS